LDKTSLISLVSVAEISQKFQAEVHGTESFVALHHFMDCNYDFNWI